VAEGVGNMVLDTEQNRAATMLLITAERRVVTALAWTAKTTLLNTVRKTV